MSSSLIDAVRTYLPADLGLPACLDAKPLLVLFNPLVGLG
jgi:hypothetical protein